VSADQIVFWVFAPISIGSAIAMLLQRNAVHAALFLIVNFFTIAVFYLVLEAPFLFAVQIIVYAGAIMVLFLFVIMLLSLRQPEESPKIPFIGQKLTGIVLAGFTGLILIYGATRVTLPPGKETLPGLGNTESIARSLFTDYLLPFEVTSVLLLVAIVGAVVLAKSKLK